MTEKLGGQNSRDGQSNAMNGELQSNYSLPVSWQDSPTMHRCARDGKWNRYWYWCKTNARTMKTLPKHQVTVLSILRQLAWF